MKGLQSKFLSGFFHFTLLDLGKSSSSQGILLSRIEMKKEEPAIEMTQKYQPWYFAEIMI